MADTLPNIPIPSDVWVDVRSLSAIPDQYNISIQNIGSSDLYYFIGDTKPDDSDRSAYRVFERPKEVITGFGDTKVWVYSLTKPGLVNVNQEPQSADEILAAAGGRAFTLTVPYSLAPYALIAVNVSCKITHVMTKASSTADLPISVRTAPSEGQLGGNFKSVNKNLETGGSGLVSGRAVYSPLPRGDVVDSCRQACQPNIVTGPLSNPSVIITNDSASSISGQLTIDFIQFGDLPEQEELLYGADLLEYSGEQLIYV